MAIHTTSLTLAAALLLPLSIALADAGDTSSRKNPAPKEIVEDVEAPDVDEAPDVAEEEPVEDPNGDTIISCWCSGGTNGSGPVQCSAEQCSGQTATACCVGAYGDGSTVSDI